MASAPRPAAAERGVDSDAPTSPHDQTLVWTRLETSVGSLLVVGTEGPEGEVLHRIGFPLGAGRIDPAAGWRRDDQALPLARRQLEEYFEGSRRRFDLRLAPTGTDFQLEVWQALAEIPYGSTISYGELARRVGRPRAVRAVGAANGRNPLPIVLPCHRVVGADGSLTGFGGGLDAKRTLLALEDALPEAQGQLPLA